MAENVEILLGNAGHTLFSDEPWYLIVPPAPGAPYLEGRFQTDAPERTGWPVWASSDDCYSRTADEATYRLALARMPRPDEPCRFASITDAIWKRVVEECAKLTDRWPSTHK